MGNGFEMAFAANNAHPEGMAQSGDLLANLPQPQNEDGAAEEFVVFELVPMVGLLVLAALFEVFGVGEHGGKDAFGDGAGVESGGVGEGDAAVENGRGDVVAEAGGAKLHPVEAGGEEALVVVPVEFAGIVDAVTAFGQNDVNGGEIGRFYLMGGDFKEVDAGRNGRYLLSMVWLEPVAIGTGEMIATRDAANGDVKGAGQTYVRFGRFGHSKKLIIFYILTAT